MNRTWAWAPWADVLYGCDIQWWRSAEAPGSGAFPGLRITQDARGESLGLLRVPGESGPGLSLDPHRIHFGNNSGFQAMNLAVHLGARLIALLGFDMDVSRGTHWHGDHGEGLKNPTDYLVAAWRRHFADAVPDLRQAGVTVVNCSRRTALTCFPRADLKDVLA